MDWLGDLAVALLVSVVTSFVTVRLSLRRFRSERIWERKEVLYSTLIEHLAAMRYVLSERYAGDLHEKELSDERWFELNGQFLDAREAVSRAAATGSFILSEEAVSVLEELNKDLNAWRKTPIEELEASMEAIQKASEMLRRIARKELKA